jgi:hypothetical protein
VVGIMGETTRMSGWIRPQLFWIVFLSRTQIVRCPYSLCQNLRCLEDKRTIAIHLCKNDFMLDYEVWTFHDESGTRVIAEDEHDCDVGGVDRMDENLKAI